jgi:hypothetical protein
MKKPSVRVIGKRRIQPALAVVRRSRLTTVGLTLLVNHLAREQGLPPITRAHLHCALRGTARPSPTLRVVLPEILDRPLDELFELRQLVLPYSGTRGRNGGRRRLDRESTDVSGAGQAGVTR